MLQENTSLERLTIQYDRASQMRVNEYLELATALRHNQALKTLDIHVNSTLLLVAYEDKQIASLLKKNYALETVSGIDRMGDVGAILRLNEVGRRYLVQDGSSISKGVDALSHVNDDINCVFLHLLENPTLCDRNAVEIVSVGESNSSTSTNPSGSSSGEGKREQASFNGCKESRRKLA
jgi:hypothetical protein